MKRYAVIGHPIEHSLSPRIHQYFAATQNIALKYDKILAPLDDFAGTVADFFAQGGNGLNVTVPFKSAAFELADERSPAAQQAAAVNTLKYEQGLLRADNTDGVGLTHDLAVNLGEMIADRRVLILGAGGAARGILAPLLQQHPKQILIANRSAKKAIQLAKTFAPYGELCGFALDKIKNESVDMIINATSVALDGAALKLPSRLAKGALCYDLSYGVKTSFMAWADGHAARRVMDGLGMLVEQAAASFECWHGVRPDTSGILKWTDCRTRRVLDFDCVSD